MANAGQSTVETSTHSTRRYWVRKESPPSFLSWPGWLWLLLLLPLLLWGLFVTAPHIERDIEDNVTKRLTGANERLALSELAVDADGQNVDISAVGPESSEDWARTVAQATKCDTWLADNMTCPIDIDVNLAQAAVAAAVVAPAVIAEPEPVVEARAHNVTAERNENGILLTGEVPSAELKASTVEQFSGLGLAVDDQLTVSADAPAYDDGWAAAQTGSLLNAAERGKVRWTDGVLSASVLVKAEQEEGVRSIFAQDDEAARLGSLEVQVLETVNRCDQEFAQLLSENKIQFNTGSASISAESNALLGRVAELASGCGLRLDIEGHTDSVGGLEMNRDLSLARATAVIEALVASGADPSDFTPYGYGPDRPIADNETADGRRANRRIEIRATKIN